MGKAWHSTLGAIGIAILFYWLGSAYSPSTSMCAREYAFINSKIICGAPDVIRKTGYAQMQRALTDLIETRKRGGRVQEVSLYFRDLEHGPAFGIRDDEVFAPASLLKIPLALVFFRSAQAQPGLFLKKIRLAGTSTSELQGVKPLVSAQIGEEYSIERLLYLMLVHSDNNSYEALEQFIANDPNRVRLRRETFQELGVIDPKNQVEGTVSVRGYSSLFRLLYNVSFLEAEYSEKMLSWLAESMYRDGLVASVPAGVSVAHKFGERLMPNGVKQLSDCGIVYYPGNPYVLCIMTRGSDWDALAQVISTISKTVYDEVDSRHL